MKPILLCLLLAAPALSSSELVGTWETRSVDEFGAGEAVFRMTLSADGSLTMGGWNFAGSQGRLNQDTDLWGEITAKNDSV